MSKQEPSSAAFTKLKMKIDETERKLEELEQALQVVGHPADLDLKKRVEALRVEECALQRNYEELLAQPCDEAERMQKVVTLLKHIEQEEASVQHEVDFLSQAAPSSVIVAAAAATRAFEVVGGALKKMLKGRHPLGESAFVNHSHDDLVKYYGLKE